MSIKYFNNVSNYLLSEGVKDEEMGKLSVLPAEFVNNSLSSYKKANYSLIFAHLVKKYRPKRISEFGVLGCYSFLSFALAIQKNSLDSEVHGYDLFEDYPYTKFKLSDAKSLVLKYIKRDIAYLHKVNVFNSNIIPEELGISSMAHIDLSNDGDTYEHFLNYMETHTNFCLIFEGGSKERDLVEWMVKYKKKPINNILEKSAKLESLSIVVINDFPSLTIVTKGN